MPPTPTADTAWAGAFLQRRARVVMSLSVDKRVFERRPLEKILSVLTESTVRERPTIADESPPGDR